MKVKIDIQNLYKHYDNDDKRAKDAPTKNVLTDLNIQIRAHEFVCVLGKSGCGKSTLLNLLAGYIKPDKGAIMVDGEKITGAGKNRGVVFQEHALFPWLTVEQNIGFGPKVCKKTKEQIKSICQKYMAMVGLEKYKDYYPDQLSGGMKQRVGIARAFANEAAILLMDEPFSALDNFTREMMQTELLNIWEKSMTTIVFITHSIEEAVFLADRVIVLGQGNVLADTKINLERKRDVYDPKFIEYVNEFNHLIEQQRNQEEA
ncbi:MAG: ABC transporter ATP-binding protein [Clostridia bacterium]|nr:ABC transporter ATP-binding protein [Clostridia bacterium]NCD02606.1 ABC transporter ATP-binding protein [Clostridia bacterium]